MHDRTGARPARIGRARGALGGDGRPVEGGRPPTVPALRTLVAAEGRYALPRAPRVVAADRRLRATAATFAADLRTLTGRRVTVASGDDPSRRRRAGARRDRPPPRPGGVCADDRAARVVVRARTRAGAFYGTRTVLQPAPPPVDRAGRCAATGPATASAGSWSTSAESTSVCAGSHRTSVSSPT